MTRYDPTRATVLGVALLTASGCASGHRGRPEPGALPAPPVSAHRAYVPSFEAGAITAIDLNTNRVLWTLEVSEGAGERPARSAMGIAATLDDRAAVETPEGRQGLIGYNGIAVTPDGDRVFVVGPEPGTLFVIDVASRDIVGRVPIGQRAHDVAISRDGAEAWVANDAGTVTIVDAETLEVLDQLDMRRFVGGYTLAHIAFSVDGGQAYLSWETDVVVVDAGSRQIVDVLPVPEEPHEITLEDYFVRP